MFDLSIQHLLILILLIVVLNWAGLWPVIIRGIREFRGERLDNPPTAPAQDLDVCFKLLGISPWASWEEIERAYRQKAKVHHPDHGGDDDAMRALNEAYSRIKQARAR